MTKTRMFIAMAKCQRLHVVLILLWDFFFIIITGAWFDVGDSCFKCYKSFWYYYEIFFFIIIMGLDLMEGTAVFDSLCFLCLSGHNVISLSIYIFSNIYANVFRIFAYFNVDCPDKWVFMYDIKYILYALKPLRCVSLCVCVCVCVCVCIGLSLDPVGKM